MRSLGQNPTLAELQDMIIGSDSSGEGALNFPDFLSEMARQQRSTYKDEDEDEIKEAFKVLDRDGDGYIGPAELRNFMTQLGDTIIDEEVDEMIRKADHDGDGKISYDDFKKMLLAN